METILLQTKLHAPPTRPDLVLRPRLREKLNAGLSSKLTLISAPAGFGKTTLVSEWNVTRRGITGESVAWLSLDKGDGDPIYFLTYLVVALQTLLQNQPATGRAAAATTIGKGVLSALQSPQPPQIEALLTILLNEIATIEDNFVLVLDDYHLLESKAVDEALTFLLDHLPPQMHLVITTREDPDLPLARYRARGQLTEVRARDLRFTPAEAAEFLNQMMDLALSAEEIAALETRTEGWIAGLQMAALSMQGRADRANFIRSFTGSHRFVLDYLAEEVLQLQPEHVQNFLLQTVILDRLSGPLCDAVTGQDNGKEILANLERNNLFVIPLDDERHWYRYHHLFADVLQARVLEKQPEQIPALHSRASAWHEQNNFSPEAIHHAFAAKDYERAAALIELTWPAIFKGFLPGTWLSWVKALPDELVRARPVLSAGYAWTLLDGGELEAAEIRLRDAERWLDISDANSAEASVAAAGVAKIDESQMVVVNEAEFRSLPATIASARAYLAQAQGDVPTTVANARRALKLLPADDHYQRGIAAMFLGMAYWTSGELEAACRSIADSAESLRKAGNVHFQVVSTVFLADIRVAQGRLRDARSTYELALQIASSATAIEGANRSAQTESAGQGTVNLYVGLSMLHSEWGELDTATQYLMQGKALGKQSVSPSSDYRLCAATARIKEVEGDLDGALDLFVEAERLYKRDALPDVRPVTAMKVRVWIRQHKLSEALEWVREQGMSIDDDLSYLREFEHITLARALIAQNQQSRNQPPQDQIGQVAHTIQGAMDLLARLLRAAEAARRMGSVIELLLLQALAHQTQGDMPSALVALERSLTLAEPERYNRLFVDEGQPMQTLLSACLAQGVAPAYTTQLLTALAQHLDDENATPTPNQLLIEPLSERELEVLRLLASGHTNQAIADDLIIAVSTVKKHVNNIFGKLSVRSRTQAVSHARELGLL